MLLAATYLNKIAEYVVNGIPLIKIAELTGLLLPAILVNSFSMSVLLAALLSFGRLSSDSEIVALRAGGASVYRIILPAAMFALAIAGVTFVFNEQVVPTAANRSKALLIDLANSGDITTGDPVVVPVIDHGALQAMISARSMNLSSRTMHDVTVTAYDKHHQPSWIMLSKEMEYRPETKEWHVRGQTTLMPAQGGWAVHTSEMWPDQIPHLPLSPQDILTQSANDFTPYTMSDLKRQIERAKSDKNIGKGRIANLEYWYWNKISVPLSALIFGALGAVLGIRNHRTGTAAGFALAVGIIFAYVTLANFMNVWAQGGVLPAWVASFLPLTVGLASAAVIMWRRNV